MFNFSCPRCGQSYQADEIHLGKNVRCTKCGDIVAIARQDGGSSNSESPLETVIEGNSVQPGSYKGAHTRPTFFSRPFLVVSTGILGLVLLYLGYLVGKSNQKPKPVNAASIWHQTAPIHQTSEPQPPPSKATDESTPVDLKASDIDLSSGLEAEAAPPARVATSRARTKPTTLPQMPARPLPTGTRISPDLATAGHGELKAMNGTNYSSHVIVVDTLTQIRVRDVGIEPQSSYLMEKLSPGNYRVVFATGNDWDDVRKRFTRNARYFRFGNDLSFAENNDDKALHYSRHTITLNPVVDGNVKSENLTEAEFHALMGVPENQ